MPPTPPSSLLLPLESLINSCIAQDPVTADRITALRGRTLEIQVTTPRLSVYTSFHTKSVTLEFMPPRNASKASGDDIADSEFLRADGRISGSAVTLLGLANRGAKRALVNPALKISGDVEFVQQVYQLFQDLEIDWQEPLSRLIGDIPTHALERFFDELGLLARGARDSVVRNIDEYLHEEARVCPPRSRVVNHARSLEDLKLRLDRLEARVRLLNTQVLNRET